MKLKTRYSPKPHFPAKLKKAALAATALTSLGFASACSDDDPVITLPTVTAIILERSDGSDYYAHGDHWHGRPTIEENHSERLEVYYIDFQPEGHDAPPKETWKQLPPTVKLVANSTDASIARWEGESDHGDIRGLKEGTTEITFRILGVANNTTVYEAPPLTVNVIEHEDHDDH